MRHSLRTNRLARSMKLMSETSHWTNVSHVQALCGTYCSNNVSFVNFKFWTIFPLYCTAFIWTKGRHSYLRIEESPKSRWSDIDLILSDAPCWTNRRVLPVDSTSIAFTWLNLMSAYGTDRLFGISCDPRHDCCCRPQMKRSFSHGEHSEIQPSDSKSHCCEKVIACFGISLRGPL